MKMNKVGIIALGMGLAVGAYAQDFCNASHSGESVKETSNKVGTIGTVGYELWGEKGNQSATFYSDGSMLCEFNGNKDYLCRSGKSYNSDKTFQELGHLYADFSVKISNTSNIDYSYIGIYGWTREPLIEWYIVDSWGSQYRPGDWVGSVVEKGVTIDGAKYDLFKGHRKSYSIDGDNMDFDQYFSVRQDKRDCGTIDITAHFEAWEAHGMKMGKMHEAKILGEAGFNGGAQATGKFDFVYAKVYTDDEQSGESSSSAAAESSSSKEQKPTSSAPASSSDAASSSSVAPASSSDAASSSSVAPASSSDIAQSSSSGVGPDALPADVKTFGMAGTYQVFDMQGKFLGKVELMSGSSLKEVVGSKFTRSSVYMVKRGSYAKTIAVER